jgi:hypothetical protein
MQRARYTSGMSEPGETIEVQCEYCRITLPLANAELRSGRGFVCRDARACRAREDKAAEDEEDE